MSTYYPTAGTIPEGFCPATWQAVINQFAPLLPIEIDGDDEVVIQEATPGADERSKLWIKLLPGAPWVGGAFVWVGDYGDWRQIPGLQFYFVDTGSANDITITTGENMTTEAFLENRLFLIKTAAANSGAVTMTVDSLAAKPLYKRNNVDMRSGDYAAGQLILVGYDPIQDSFDVLTILQDPAAPDPTAPAEEIQQMVPNENLFSDFNVTGTISITHGFGAIPTNVRVVLKCLQAEAGYAIGDEVDIWSCTPGATGDGNPDYNTGLPTCFRVSSDDEIINISVNSLVNEFWIPGGPGVNGAGRFAISKLIYTKWGLRTYAFYIAPKSITITGSPVSVTSGAGTNVSFGVSVSGDTPITYQWKRNGVDIFDGGRLSGCDTDTLTITGIVDGAVPTGDEASYACLVDNVVSNATSAAATLTVT